MQPGCGLILLLTYCIPQGGLVCLSCLNNTPGPQCAEMSTVQPLQGILR